MLSVLPGIFACVDGGLRLRPSALQLANSNLGGLGPDVGAADGMRFVNVASFEPADAIEASHSYVHVDLVITNRSAYTPADADMNVGYLGAAVVSAATNSTVDLHGQLMLSCATADSCADCDYMRGTEEGDSMRDACYSRGCSCFGETVHSATDCSGAAREAKRLSYGCAAAASSPTLPEAMKRLAISVLDLDGGLGGGCAQSVTWHTGFSSFTPLVPSSGNAVASLVQVDTDTAPPAARLLSTSTGDAPFPVTAPAVTEANAASAGLLVFDTVDGSFDATFEVVHAGGTATACGGGSFVFAAAAPCAMPPSPPAAPCEPIENSVLEAICPV